MIEGIEAAAISNQAQGTHQVLQNQPTSVESSQHNITSIIQQAEMLDQNGTVGQLSSSIETNSLNKIGDEQSFGEKLVQSVSKMDGNYSNIMENLNNWPDFESYLSKKGISSSQEINAGDGITHISNIGKGGEVGEVNKAESVAEAMNNSYERMEQLQTKQEAYQAAGIEYSQDSMRWSISTDFWLSKVRILTSAVSQVSTGLRTLFNAQ